jgi:CRP/FNR family cyclic AMP-dependent transcriptional regulator
VPVLDADLMCAGWAGFTGLDRNHAAVSALAGRSQLRRLPRGTALLIEGQSDKSVYLLIAGSLRTLRYLADGQEVWLTDTGPGELIGEMAALTDGVRTSSVFTRSEASVAVIEQQAFLAVAEQHGAFGLAVARLLARRLANTSRQMADLAALPVASRLHRELLRIGHPSPVNGELVRVLSPPNVSTLARRIHASRETTSRALKDLETRGYVMRTEAGWVLPMPMHEVDPPPPG